jgi:hypothetical protein
LAGVAKYLRSLGQYDGNSGFQGARNYKSVEDVPEEFLEERSSAFGVMKAVKHSASIEGVDIGWETMSQPLGSDQPIWL